MSYLTEMVGLATHNFFSAAVGIVVAVALIRGIKRTSFGDHRQLLGRHDAHAALHPAAGLRHLCAAAGGAGRSAEPACVHRGAHARAAVQTQTIGQGPVASQEAIKMLGTNGGGFFNANSAHPYRESDAAFELPADPFDLHHSRRPDLHAGPHDRLAGPRLGGVRGDVRSVRGRIHRVLLGRGASASADSWRGSRPRTVDRAGRQHGGQGSAQRHRRKRALRHHHHRRQLRRSEWHARQLYAARRHGAAHQHHARRSRLWRRRRRASTAC